MSAALPESTPLTPAQERVWLAEALRPGSPGSVLATAVALAAGHLPAEVRRALRAAVAADADLCAHYTGAGRTSADAGGLRVPVVDLRNQTDEDRVRAFAELRVEQAARRFDLAGELPVRALLAQLPGEWVLVLTAHRIALPDAGLDPLLRAVFGADPVPVPVDPPYGAAEVDRWRAVLRDLPPASVPTDRPRPLVGSQVGACVPLVLPAEPAEPDTDVLLAVLHALLVRLGGETDVVVTLITGAGERTVVRVDLGDDPSLTTLRQRVGAARAIPAVPFAVLSGELAPHDPKADPFAPVALVIRDRPPVAEPLRVLPGGPVGVDHELRLVLARNASGKLVGRLDYATDLFQPITAERIAARYGILLAAAVAEPDLPLSAHDLLTEPERLLLHTWNDTATDFPAPRCLHELIAERAALDPGAPAVVCGEQELTYGELDLRADRLAHRLAALGVRPGRLAAVCTRRSPDTIVAILAILKAGGGYVPVDPAYPAHRLSFLLTDCQATVVLTDAVSRPHLPDSTAVVLELGEPDAAPGDEPVGPPDVSVTPDDPCYLIYTSGSTGQPKGALNTHRGVLNTMTALIARIRVDSDTRLLQTSSLSFDMSAFDILSALLAGACLVIPQPDEVADPVRLLDLVHRQRVTAWSSAPPLFKAVLEEAMTSVHGLPEQLRTVLVGGDRFPPTACAAMHDMIPGCRAFNFAGMTEVSFTTTAYGILAADGERTSVPWGMPLPNQRMYVLDPVGRLVPPGVPGELYIGGAGVGLGYWRRPELTEQRFLPDPFVPGDRMYRTGDRVRHLADGNLEFLGRLDQQVKVRGFRIELGEVENTLATHPLVGDVVAGIRPDEATEDHRLVAYVTFRDQASAASVEELRAYLGERLPEHLVPSTFVEVPAIPLLPSGKIDRAGLDSLDLPAARPRLATPYVRPRNGLEQRIVDEWSQVLGVDRIGVNDEFVALGGHSMLATPTMATLAMALGVALSARDLYESPTPAGLAARVRALAPDRTW